MLAAIMYVKDQLSDPYNRVFIYECKTEDEKKALEIIYREFNHVDGSEHIATLGQVRSMSVGDIVYFPNSNERSWYFCDGCGWKTISNGFVIKYLELVTFRDSLMGYDWVLKTFPDLKELE